MPKVADGAICMQNVKCSYASNGENGSCLCSWGLLLLTSLLYPPMFVYDNFFADCFSFVWFVIVAVAELVLLNSTELKKTLNVLVNMNL